MTNLISVVKQILLIRIYISKKYKLQSFKLNNNFFQLLLFYHIKSKMGGICCSTDYTEDINQIVNKILMKKFNQARTLTKKLLDQNKNKPKIANLLKNIDSIIRLLEARSQIRSDVKYLQSNINKPKSDLKKISFQTSDQSFIDENTKIYKIIEDILLRFKKFIKQNKQKNPSVSKNMRAINIYEFQQQIQRQKRLHERYEQLIKQLPYNEKTSTNELKLEVKKLLRDDFEQFYDLTKDFIKKYEEYQVEINKLKDIQKKLKDKQHDQDNFEYNLSFVSRSPSQIEMQNTLTKPKQNLNVQQNKNNYIKKQEYEKLKEIYKQEKQKLLETLQVLQKEKKNLKINLQRMQQKCNGYMIKVQDLNQYTYKLQTHQKKIQTQYKQLFTKTSMIENEKQMLKKELINRQTIQQQKLKEQIKKNEILNKKNIQQIQKSAKQNLEKQIQKNKLLNQQKNQQIQKNKTKENIIKKLQEEKKLAEDEYKKKQTQFILFKNKIEEERSSANNLTDNEQQEEKENLRLLAFFQGDILFKFFNEKKWMVSQIEDLIQARITRTRMLYKLDRLSNVNFHQYFDGRPNILLIVQLKNGYILAGFSTIPFIKNQTNTNFSGEGLIMSLTNEQSFKLKQTGQKVRPITYDQYYLMYGNSQLRLRFKDDMFFSNFGILNSYYNSNGKKVDVLLNYGKERQIQLHNYEIYEVIF